MAELVETWDGTVQFPPEHLESMRKTMESGELVTLRLPDGRSGGFLIHRIDEQACVAYVDGAGL